MEGGSQSKEKTLSAHERSGGLARPTHIATGGGAGGGSLSPGPDASSGDAIRGIQFRPGIDQRAERGAERGTDHSRAHSLPRTHATRRQLPFPSTVSCTTGRFSHRRVGRVSYCLRLGGGLLACKSSAPPASPSAGEDKRRWGGGYTINANAASPEIERVTPESRASLLSAEAWSLLSRLTDPVSFRPARGCVRR